MNNFPQLVAMGYILGVMSRWISKVSKVAFALKRQFRFPAVQSFVSCGSKWFPIYSLMKPWSVILVSVLCTCIRCLRAHLMWRCFIHRSFTLMIQRSIKPTESACYAGWLYVGLCVCACIWTLTETSVCCTESELRWTLTVCLTHSSVNQHTF